MGKIAKLTQRISTLDTRQGSSPSTERIRGYKLSKIRERIGLRDCYTCRLCGRVTAHGEVDHVTPLHMGGQETDENRQWLDRECHRLKSEREEKERGY